MLILRLMTWLRANAERYLLADAQEQMARRYLGRDGPAGAKSLFWRRLFVPVHKRLPWSWRQTVMKAMPGSHRKFGELSGASGRLARTRLAINRRTQSLHE